MTSVPAAQRAQATRIQRQLEGHDSIVAMDNDLKKVKYRVSKKHGSLMVFIGFLFDLMPLLLILIATGFIFSQLNNTATETFCEEDAWYNKVLDYRIGWGDKSNLLDKYTGKTVCEFSTRASAAIAMIGGGFIVGPMLYFIGSLLSIFLAFFVFLAWFGVRKVFVLSPKPGRLVANLLTLIIECLPIFNILPGITFAVWRHVRISQKEDETKHRQQMNKRQQQTAEMLRNQRAANVPTYRRTSMARAA